MIIFDESYKFYQDNIEPIIPSLNKKWSKEIVLYKSPEFRIIRDINWKGNQLHILTIPNVEISSIRQLNDNHLSLLNKMNNETELFLQSNYNLPVLQQMSFYHYYPTIWQLHMHTVNVDNENYKKFDTGYTHLHNQVVRNIQQQPNYYQSQIITVKTDTKKFKTLLNKINK